MLYQKLTNNNYSLLKKFYNNLQEQLIDATFDTHFSGTTMVIVYQIDNKINKGQSSFENCLFIN